MGELEELEEIEAKIKKLKEEKRKAKPEPFESAFLWFILLVCAPWLLVVAENFGRNGWGFDHWDKWRLHWIPLTYLLYFGVGFLLFPTVEFVLYLGFPILLAVGLAGLISMSTPFLWIGVFLAVYVLVVFLAHTGVGRLHSKRRERADRKKVLEEGFVEE